MLQVNIECTESDSVMRKKCTETHFLFFFSRSGKGEMSPEPDAKQRETDDFCFVFFVASFSQQHDDNISRQSLSTNGTIERAPEQFVYVNKSIS